MRKNSAKLFSRNCSAKSLREIIDLPRELIVQGDYDLARFASTLKTEKANKGAGIAEYFQKRKEGIVILLGKCDFMTLLHSQCVYILTLHFPVTNC